MSVARFIVVMLLMVTNDLCFGTMPSTYNSQREREGPCKDDLLLFQLLWIGPESVVLTLFPGLSFPIEPLSVHQALINSSMRSPHSLKSTFSWSGLMLTLFSLNSNRITKNSKAYIFDISQRHIFQNLTRLRTTIKGDR